MADPPRDRAARSAPMGLEVTKDAWQILRETSRTFYIPIVRLPDGLREAVGAAYLCMRSIDEIEDHRGLDPGLRADLLRAVSRAYQEVERDLAEDAFGFLGAHAGALPEVSLRIGEWSRLAPAPVRARVWDAIAAMADRMAWFAEGGFSIRTEPDLNRYTYAVAGAVGLLLSDLWAWHSGTHTDRTQALAFGRGLQAVNMLRNRDEDLGEGVDFFPDGWAIEDMERYAQRQLEVADAYTESLPKGPIREFCAIPLQLAEGTLRVMSAGRSKLTRDEVADIVERATAGAAAPDA